MGRRGTPHAFGQLGNTPPSGAWATVLDLSAARFCDTPFPSYRFVPGRHPHPTAHPDGHSYEPPGSPPHPVTWYPPEDWSRSADYLYGCDLYNHAYWWEAHEAWEGLWQLTDKGGVQGQFLQGLIQVTACQLKIFSGQPAGPARLRETSLGYLRRARAGTDSETYMGLDLARFVESVEAYWRLAIDAAGSTPRHEPASYPYIHLIA